MSWYTKYVGLPHKHLGNNPHIGIDCVNLCIHIYKEELDIVISPLSHTFCNIAEDDWYNKTTIDFFVKGLIHNDNWQKVSMPKPYDLVLLSLGSTNVSNHCAMYVGNNKILHTMPNKKSWLAPYGNYYKQYTVGIFRWKSLKN